MSPLPELNAYDALVVLYLTSADQLSTNDTRIRSVVQEAARLSQKRLLISLPLTQLWTDLAADRAGSFDAVQAFLGRLYVYVSVALQEDVAADVVIDQLRGKSLLGEQAGKEEQLRTHFATVRVHGSPQEIVGTETVPRNADHHALGTIALGGTFDHLHAGHKILLTMACWLASRRVIVGITDDALLKAKKYRYLLESLEYRTKAVQDLLQLVCPEIQHDTPALQDVYGPTAYDPDVQGVIVSEETRGGAASIADKRREQGLNQLHLFVIHVITPESVLDISSVSKSEMLKVKIGSTQIRERLAQQTQRA